ncbi:ABC-three component system protein [Billgrantia aerodenitrificans]|uniref:ABC-three component systems C-terminal domain-containing protein n=1 Tax=Billgrantia aerodenitrificans TaxID=2733483 RepID=A0ABS9ALV4_9GAMM|nr:ABC-three component system protein [Halomonas aerodenitrificans]MCE8022729.1 hypothetical protein [Halomonas aerodenitrificans]
MNNGKSFSELTSADKKEVGFHYQYYYFLYRLLNLKSGQSVGLEVKDDVHTELDNDTQILFQLKHTVQKNAADFAVALAELDNDLWKTLHNWAKIISDESVGRKHGHEQIAFIAKTEFHLVTNKSESHKNNFLKNLECYKFGSVSSGELKSYIETLYRKTQNSHLKNYIKVVLTLEDKVFQLFMSKIYLEQSVEDLHSLIKKSIREKMVANSKVDIVFERLDSNIRTDNYFKIKQGQKVEVDFDSFYSRYRNIFSASREPLQLGKPFKPAYPDDVFSQVFIKQLIAIKAMKDDDVEKAYEYTLKKLKITRFLEDWLQSGELVSDEIIEFHGDVKNKWQNGFEHWCQDCLDHEAISKAKSLLYDLRQIEFTIASSKLNTELSNGEIYHLSDERIIGWHRDWEDI